MKTIFYPVTLLFVFAACKTSKNYLSRSDEDKTIFDVIKKLGKSPNDADAATALPTLYQKAQERHLRTVNNYSSRTDINRWEKIGDAYNTLNRIYDAVNNAAGAAKLINPVSYHHQFDSIKQLAAEDYYQQGLAYLTKQSRDDAKLAYNSFKKAESWVSGYKDARAKKEEAYQSAIVNVQINPVHDNAYFFNTGWGNTGYNYSNEYFQQTLVRELGRNNNRYPARFYTDWEARRDNVKPDWVVDLTLRNIDMPYPSEYKYSRNAETQVEYGSDSSGRPLYKTVYTTVNITRRSFTARGQIDININDVNTRRNISYNTVREDYYWQDEAATYTGDSRALSNNDWQLISNKNYNTPRKDEIIQELYKKMYPQVKNKISYAVDW
jgi:hypothetical protein